MKYFYKYFLFLLLVSCSSAKFISNIVKVNEVNEMSYFDPLTSISLIDEQNKVTINDSILQKVNLKFNSVIKEFELSKISEKKNRFVLVTGMFGFGRVNKNYRKELAKGFGIGLLTGGLYTPIPIKANLTIQTLIFDKNRKKVVFYGYTMPSEDSPFNKNNIEVQFKNSFKGFFLSY